MRLDRSARDLGTMLLFPMLVGQETRSPLRFEMSRYSSSNHQGEHLTHWLQVEEKILCRKCSGYSVELCMETSAEQGHSERVPGCESRDPNEWRRT